MTAFRRPNQRRSARHADGNPRGRNVHVAELADMAKQRNDRLGLPESLSSTSAADR